MRMESLEARKNLKVLEKLEFYPLQQLLDG
jgi:hypothetical protein